MFANQPSWSHVGSAASYRWMTTFVAIVYLATWIMIGTLVQDPWQTPWMLVAIFGPLLLIAVCLPAWIALNDLQQRVHDKN